ncbi:hypothetical protein, partial [Vibrio cyclitrophicus]|uniref:hypothetical protein n=1 Tax=Vibrio cyclitrophicus TaxID=47951 RepID=UPI001A7E1A1D
KRELLKVLALFSYNSPIDNFRLILRIELISNYSTPVIRNPPIFHGKIINIPVNKGLPEPLKDTHNSSHTLFFYV